jgi:hypothetical protein
MQHRLDEIINPQARMDWGAAVLAGVIAGAIDWLLSHGMPWFTSGLIAPNLMGRDLHGLGAFDGYSDAMTILAQFVIGIGYGLIVAPLVTHLRGLWAIATGGLLGLGLYGLNFCVFHFLVGVHWSAAELSVIVAHVVFGLVVAGLYKGLAARKFLANRGTPA